jgi:hypothetical protein
VTERDAEAICARIVEQVRAERVRITRHASEEMVAEGVTLDDVYQAMSRAELLEDYPDHRRGACCLLGGRTRLGRALHVVSTTDLPLAVVITVYEPKPPKWMTPTVRGGTR